MSHLRRDIYFSLGIFALCIFVRWPHMSQSLWLDEMTTLAEYVGQPWQKILAPAAGEYAPNNHVLHTVLAKLAYGDGAVPPHEWLLRLPALIAGSLLPIALAWPLRREPIIALGIALVASVHPWFVAFSSEARGYSLMLLLGIIATNLLPDGRRRWSIGYAATLALAVYTIPVAILLLPAHFIAAGLRGRAEDRGSKIEDRKSAQQTIFDPLSSIRYLRPALLALAIIAALYAPMYHGLVSYYRHPYLPTIRYRTFLDLLPRYALAGERLPRWSHPYLHLPDRPSEAIYWALPVLTIIIGSVLGWSRVALRSLLVTLGVLTLMGVLLPLVFPAATEVRFVPWIAPLFCVTAVALLGAAQAKYAKIAGILGVLVLISWETLADMAMLPNQPIREGLHQVDQITPPGRDIIVLYLGARESIGFYGNQVTRHALIPAPDTASFLTAERMSRESTGRSPWVIIFFEQLARDRDSAPPETRGLWTELAKNYKLACPRLNGRVAPVAIYAPTHEPVQALTAATGL